MAVDREVLARAADIFGTPLYVYDVDVAIERFRALKRAFGKHFGVSYAVKVNPNVELLKRLLPEVATFDVSSYKEVERVIAAGCPPHQITFSGPAKRPQEVRGAVQTQIGELVLESVAEAEMANRAALEMGVRQPVLLRINPIKGPKNFGLNFSGRATQFGVDEEVLEPALDRILALPGLDLVGFHIFSGASSLNADAIVENFGILSDVFRKAAAHSGVSPRKLVFGSGFGIPYGPNETALDIEALAAGVLPVIDQLKSEPRFADAECILEMGRWLVGPAGWLLTSVIGAKSTRGVEIRMCDAGFNNHAAAAGMMGTVIRRNWRMENISNPNGGREKYTLAGPLCTSHDVLATAIDLPEIRIGDVITIENSGAYGLTGSPTRFISHPEPSEIMVSGGEFIDVTESAANQWTSVQGRPAAPARAPIKEG